MSLSEKALHLLRFMPRLGLNNAFGDPRIPKMRKKVGQYAERHKKDNKSNEQRQRYHPPGYKPGQTPFFLRCPIQNYYEDILHRRQHPPFSLFELQHAIDTRRIRCDQPIDLATLCNSFLYYNDATDSQYGVHLTDDGIDCFKAKVNIEVQYASEHVISAIERNGGVITTAYFDIKSVAALSDPLSFFKKGEPIPKRLLPPPDVIDYYTDAKNRGYLADPKKIAYERMVLAQKYGYELPDILSDPDNIMLMLKKDPRQIFFGLEPGWVVNLADKEILAPVDESFKEYYKT